MSSQIDMFASQSPIKKGKMVRAGVKLPPTCPARLCFFKWLLCFDWDEEEEKPFQVYPVSKFGNEIKESWIQGVLSPASRRKKIRLEILENQTISLFGKIESSKFSY